MKFLSKTPALLGSLVLLASGAAHAVPITAQFPTLIRQTWTPNTIDFLPNSGDTLELVLTVVDTDTLSVGPPGTVVTATNSAILLTVAVPQVPGFPSFFDTGDTIPTTPGLVSGAWTFDATNGLDSATGELVVGPVTMSDVPDFAGNLTVLPNGLSPTITWTLPAEPVQAVRVRVFDDDTDMVLLNTLNLGASTTSFTLPTGVLPGSGDYAVRVLLQNRDSAAPGNVVIRSNAFVNFSVPEPSTVACLLLGLAGVVASRRRRAG